MQVVLDVENTVTERDGKKHFDPFEPTNTLVMVGVLLGDNDSKVFTINHTEKDPDDVSELKSILGNCTCLVGHNLVHDLVWLWECGFKYDGPIYDTMVAEYVMLQGVKDAVSLDACSERHNLIVKKQDTLKKYLADGVSVDEVPHAELTDYLIDDLRATYHLKKIQTAALASAEYSSLRPTIDLSNKVTACLARMNQRGFAVDREALAAVRLEYETEQATLRKELQEQAQELMGDYPINLNSPAQLSSLVYSRVPKDKKLWADEFAERMSGPDHRRTVSRLSDVVYKKKAIQCSTCRGSGKTYKTKKNGERWAKPTKCPACVGEGYLYENRGEIAGLKFMPPRSSWVTADGFSTGKDELTVLSATAASLNDSKAKSFLDKMMRLNAISSYLSAFVNGIDTFTKPDGKLHVQLTQTITATGRFSGRNPNMQNMPRGSTFPIKKSFRSRWANGLVLEADFAQLEFRVAAFLSQDETAMKEILEGTDVHAYTSKVITEAGQPTSRQEAKAHTFAPLFGATGYGRTQAEAAYYHHFIAKYAGIAAWHQSLAKSALNKGFISTPSGRQFAFPNITRRRNGNPSEFTRIKNYPVQSFATADIVPFTLLYIEHLLKGMQSCIVNSVHDSLVIDVHPDELEQVKYVIKRANNSLVTLINKQWDIDFNVPLLLECKIGPNWLEVKDVA